MPRTVRVLVRLFLGLYPPAFRRGWGHAYREAAADRWGRERAAGRGLFSFTLFLARDTLRELPAAWTRRGQRPPGHRKDPGHGASALRRWLEGLVWDARIAFRALRRRPGLTALVAGTLALGIGANAAIFGVLDRVILRPFPFPGGERMAYVVDRNVQQGFSVAPSQAEVEAWRDGSRTVERLEVLLRRAATLRQGDEAVHVPVVGVSGGLPGMIRLQPVVGRALGPADAAPDATAAIMLAEDYWRSRFGSDPTVVGRTLTLREQPVVVVGVWPSDTRLRLDAPPALYEVLPRGHEVDRASFTQALALLAPGVSRGQVQAELGAIQDRVLAADGETPDGWRPALTVPSDYLGPAFSRGLWILYVGVALLLIAATANAANLLLNRAVDRESELGIRLALGGGRGRLTRVFLLESAILGIAGAALGIALARAAGSVMASAAPPDIPSRLLAGVGGRVPGYALLLVAGVVGLCGLVPALHLRSPRIRRLLGGRNTAGSARGLLRSVLVGAQVALASVLVVGAVLTVRSLKALSSVDPGFALSELVTVTTRLPETRYPTDADRAEMQRRMEEGIAALPGVVGVDGSGTALLSYSISSGEPRLVGDDRESSPDRWTAVAGAEEDFFRVLGIPVLAGRVFEPQDLTDGASRVVVVNRAFAERYPAGVVGRALQFAGDTVPYQVVGVVDDVKTFSLRDRPGGIQVYHPEGRGSAVSAFLRFNVRVRGDPERVLSEALDRVHALDPTLPMPEGRTGLELLHEETADERFLALLLAVFAAISLSLAVAGVYGALSLQVARRTRELGVRMALGADRGRVLGVVFREGMRPVVLGALLGGAAAAVLVRYVRAVLYDVSPVDPVSFVTGMALLLAGAGVALLVPARRATRVPPSEALRAD